MKLQSKADHHLALTASKTIAPGAVVELTDQEWAGIKDAPVVVAYLDSGLLVDLDAPKQAEEQPATEAADDDSGSGKKSKKSK